MTENRHCAETKERVGSDMNYTFIFFWYKMKFEEFVYTVYLLHMILRINRNYLSKRSYTICDGEAIFVFAK